MNFNTFIRQPTTIHALGVMAAGFGAALAQVTTGNHTVDAAVAVVAYVATHLGIDDHSALETSVTALTADVVHQAPVTRLAGDAAAVLTTGQAALTVTPAPTQPTA